MENLIAHTIDLDQRTKDVKTQEDTNFQSMFLSEKVFKGLTLCGFQKPSPIQLKAIPLGRCGFDLVVKSKSGTGKTLVFSIIALEMVDPTIQQLQVLILAPTREIAVQIVDVMVRIGKFVEGLNVGVFIGGSPEKEDIDKLHNCHIAVGAPGRIKSLIKQNYMKTTAVRLFILDEADKLMEKQFQKDVNEIYSSLPLKKQIIALSATYPDELQEFLSSYMQSPTQVNAEIDTPLLLGMKQYVREVQPATNSTQEMKYKNEELLKLLSSTPFTQCLIFSNYQTRAETISHTINKHGWSSTFISAAQTQKQRLESLDKLKNFKCRVLLSTDLTARGIDAANVDLIINYDVPIDVMTYLHRMGRAGRYGSKGICISLICGKKDLNQFRKFLGYIGGTELTVPKLSNINLDQIDPKELEQISGIVGTKNEVENIKNEVISMKDNKKDVGKTQSENATEDTRSILETMAKGQQCDFNLSQSEDSRPILEAMAKGQLFRPPTPNFEKAADDPRTILELMAKGQSNFETRELKNALQKVEIEESDDKKRKRAADVPDESLNILVSLSKAEFDFEKVFKKDSEEKKRKINDNDDNKHKIFSKNKALFEVAKILTNQTENFDSNLEKNVQTYLRDSKKQFENVPTTKSLDDIFLHAYQFAIEGKNNWKNFVSEQDLELKQIEKEESEDEYIGDNYEDYEELSEGDSEDIDHDENGKRIYAYEEIPNRMVWVPVEKSVLNVQNGVNLLTEDEESTNYDQAVAMRDINLQNDPRPSNQMDMLRTFNREHFENCFQQCSDELWQHGTSFDTVEDFDNWFYHWQQRVYEVSDYVRQNLYVKEMSSYQNQQRFA